MITSEQKQRILEAITANRANYPSDAKHAASLGIATSVYSAIKNGQTDKALSEANWITIARRLGVNLRGGIEWKAARTATFDFITTQLEACQQGGLSAIMCDIPNIGKTFTARYFVQGHRNAIYVDCSQVKTKLKLVRKIATEFGVSVTVDTAMCMKIWFTISVLLKIPLSYWTKQATCLMKRFLNSKPCGMLPKGAALGI